MKDYSEDVKLAKSGSEETEKPTASVEPEDKV